MAVLREARRRASPGALTVVYAPRLEAWAASRRQPADPDSESADGEGTVLVAGTQQRPGDASPLRGMQDIELQLPRSPRRGAGRPPRQRQAFVDAPHVAEEAPASPPRLAPWRPDPLRQGLAVVALPALNVAAAMPANGTAEAAAYGTATEATDAWAVAEQVLRGWPRDAPLLLLATCHAPLRLLPRQLLALFGGGGGGCASGLVRCGSLLDSGTAGQRIETGPANTTVRYLTILFDEAPWLHTSNGAHPRPVRRLACPIVLWRHYAQASIGSATTIRLSRQLSEPVWREAVDAAAAGAASASAGAAAHAAWRRLRTAAKAAVAETAAAAEPMSAGAEAAAGTADGADAGPAVRAPEAEAAGAGAGRVATASATNAPAASAAAKWAGEARQRLGAAGAAARKDAGSNASPTACNAQQLDCALHIYAQVCLGFTNSPRVERFRWF